MSENKQAYISHVHLKGYKSIRDMEIDLLPGLNIIIGPNGSGKTNFLEFLSENINKYSSLINTEFEQKITFSNGKVRNTKGSFQKDEDGKEIFIIMFERLKKEKVISKSYDSYENGKYIGKYDGPNIKESPFGLGIGDYFYPFSQKVHFNHIFQQNITITEEFKDGNLFYTSNPSLNSNYSNHYGTSTDDFFCKLIIGLYNNGESLILDKRFDNEYKDIVQQLRKITVIKDIRVQKENIEIKTHIIHEEDPPIITKTLSNIMKGLQFFVNNQWLFFNQLSDGTKRLFYLILVVLSTDKLILTEEPELGIHPDQLSRLMDFLNEQSRTKQIIITTHSPQVLNELKEGELDRIIVTRHEGEKGTQMYHLSEEEKGFAKGYMENGAFLSDYWVQSGFMNEAEIV